jgi:hypothetical protein
MSSELNKAIAYAVNYTGMDARVEMPDWELADLLEPYVQKWLNGKTDVQRIEAMTPEERAKIGKED